MARCAGLVFLVVLIACDSDSGEPQSDGGDLLDVGGDSALDFGPDLSADVADGGDVPADTAPDPDALPEDTAEAGEDGGESDSPAEDTSEDSGDATPDAVGEDAADLAEDTAAADTSDASSDVSDTADADASEIDASEAGSDPDADPNTAPFVSAPQADLTGTVRRPVTVDLSAAFTDPDGDDLTFSLGGLPPRTGLTFDEETGLLDGAPARADLLASPLALSVTATDPGGLSATDDFTLDLNRLAELSVADLVGDLGLALVGQTSNQIGRQVGGIGDLDGDGFDDFAFTAPYNDEELGTLEAVFVVYGGTSPLSGPIGQDDFDGLTGFVVATTQSRDILNGQGIKIDGAGDFDGDGFDDLLLGLPASDRLTGQAWVIWGGPALPALISTGDLGTGGFALAGAGEVGRDVAGGEDVNGDGYDDIVIGAPKEGVFDAPGIAWVVFGGARSTGTRALEDLDGSDGFGLSGPAPLDRNGTAVALLRDATGDGLADVLSMAFAAPADPDPGAGFPVVGGQGYIYYGARDGFPAIVQGADLDGSAGVVIEAPATNSSIGLTDSGSAGDVNGDGLTDVVVADPAGTARAVYVIFGQAGGLGERVYLAALAEQGFSFSAGTAQLGVSVSSADVDGDGVDDLMVGAQTDPTGTSTTMGSVYTIYGNGGGFPESLTREDLVDGALGLVLRGSASGQFLGTATAGAGDINGDGFEDLVMGSNSADLNGNNSGAVWVLFGGDARGRIDFAGTALDDLFEGDEEPNAIIGGLGNDALDGLGGTDSLRGGAGDDELVYRGDARRIAGGGGVDVLIVDEADVVLGPGLGPVLEGIDIISLIGTAGPHRLELDFLAASRLPDAGARLRILGDADDTIVLGEGYRIDEVETGEEGFTLATRRDGIGSVLVSDQAILVMVLLDQLGPAVGGIAAQDFSPADYDGFDCQTALDVNVPAGETWVVQRLLADGIYQESVGPAGTADALAMSFYRGDDAGGGPSTDAVQHVTYIEPQGDGAGFLDVPLDVTFATPDVYWVALATQQNPETDGQWIALTQDRRIFGDLAWWRNPNDGFATGCTDWGLFVDCVGPPEADLSVRLEGIARRPAPIE